MIPGCRLWAYGAEIDAWIDRAAPVEVACDDSWVPGRPRRALARVRGEAGEGLDLPAAGVGGRDGADVVEDEARVGGGVVGEGDEAGVGLGAFGGEGVVGGGCGGVEGEEIGGRGDEVVGGFGGRFAVDGAIGGEEGVEGGEGGGGLGFEGFGDEVGDVAAGGVGG